jgi:nucleolar protein 9
MPKERKIRGRRAGKDKKRKHEDAAEENSSKRRRHSNDDVHTEQPLAAEDGTGHEGLEEAYPPALEGAYPHPGDMPFYGLLDEEEQEYFRSADEMLELNQFSSPEDRETFLNSVYKEAEGKELKMANSQSCSRLMERLIQMSNAAQLKSLFQKFSGQYVQIVHWSRNYTNISTSFLHLVQHRFASHCCEALFTQAAPIVTTEIKSPPQPSADDPNEIFVTMEELVLSTVKELEEYLGYLLTDKFASHTLRILLAVLSGQPLSRTDTKGSVLYSKKKEHISVVNAGGQQETTSSTEKRVVPDSFTTALDKFVSQSVSGFDTAFLQSLSMHPTGNPTMQLLLQLELTVFGKQKARDENSITHKLLPDDPITDDSVSGKFINSSVYDPLGSRLLETIIMYAPGKLFKSIYKTFFKERMAQLARNDTASYVVCTVLNRLSKDDLQEVQIAIADQIPFLINERNRINVIKTLIERSVAREIDTAPIAHGLRAAYCGPSDNNFDIAKMLKLGSPTVESNGNRGKEGHAKAQHASEKLHGSLLAQAMVAVPGPLNNLISDSFLRIGTLLLLQIAKDQNASRALQAALSTPAATVITRRKLIQSFYGHIGEMALDPSASHVVDAIWAGTAGLAFIRERIAEELAENEAAMRESHVGRAVWRNWRMDIYKRRRRDWVAESRASAGIESFLPFPEEGENGTGDEDTGKGKQQDKHLSAIEKARLKHAAAKRQGESTGANAVKVKQREKRERDDEGENREPDVQVEDDVADAPASPDAQPGAEKRKRKKRKSTAV